MPRNQQHVLRELAAPPGWTALLLLQNLPLNEEEQLVRYRDAATQLLEALPVPPGTPEDLLLLFGRCRPAIEVPVFRANASWWMPRFGVGLWMHQPPPTMWTREEIMLTPGRPRPIVERVALLSNEPATQRAAWFRMLGSGAVLRVSRAADRDFIGESTDLLQPTIADESLTSFPFYVPLLTAAALLTPAPHLDIAFDEQLPGAFTYLRESIEDGGLLVLVRQEPVRFWRVMQQNGQDKLTGFAVERITPSSS